MELLKFNITKQNIVCDRKRLVSETENVYECEFTFDEEWEGYIRWAVFKQNENAYKVLLNDDKCLIPIIKSGYLQVGVYGLKDNKRYPTIYTFPLMVQIGCAEGEYPPQPLPSEWEQAVEYMAKIDDVETDVFNIKQDILDLQNEITRIDNLLGDVPEGYDFLIVKKGQ